MITAIFAVSILFATCGLEAYSVTCRNIIAGIKRPSLTTTLMGFTTLVVGIWAVKPSVNNFVRAHNGEHTMAKLFPSVGNEETEGANFDLERLKTDLPELAAYNRRTGQIKETGIMRFYARHNPEFAARLEAFAPDLEIAARSVRDASAGIVISPLAHHRIDDFDGLFVKAFFEISYRMEFSDSPHRDAIGSVSLIGMLEHYDNLAAKTLKGEISIEEAESQPNFVNFAYHFSWLRRFYREKGYLPGPIEDVCVQVALSYESEGIPRLPGDDDRAYLRAVFERLSADGIYRSSNPRIYRDLRRVANFSQAIVANMGRKEFEALMRSK